MGVMEKKRVVKGRIILPPHAKVMFQNATWFEVHRGDSCTLCAMFGGFSKTSG